VTFLGIDSTRFSYLFFLHRFLTQVFFLVWIPKGFDPPPESGATLTLARGLGLRFLRVRTESIYFLRKKVEQCRGRYEVEGKTARIEDRLPKESYYGKRQDALVLQVRFGNGRTSPLTSYDLSRCFARAI
jgi:hypothetical protein